MIQRIFFLFIILIASVNAQNNSYEKINRMLKSKKVNVKIYYGAYNNLLKENVHTSYLRYIDKPHKRYVDMGISDTIIPDPVEILDISIDSNFLYLEVTEKNISDVIKTKEIYIPIKRLEEIRHEPEENWLDIFFRK